VSTALRTGYKQTEVGVIPEDWEVKPLQALADKIMVGIASAATHAYRDQGIVMFRNQNIKPGYLDDSDVLYIAEDYEEAFRNKRLKGGDLLTARTGYPGTTSIVPLQYEGAQSFTTLITRPRRGVIDSAYLCIFINSEAGQAFFEQNQIGGGQKNVNAGSLKNLPVAFPPTRAEQEAIAEVLSDTDTLIESLEQLITKKRHLKQGAMQELLTGEKRLPGFSGEWEVKRLGDLFAFSGGYSASRDQLSTKGHCYLHYGDIHKSSKTFIDVRTEYQDIPKLDIPLRAASASSLLEDGDVVFVDASEDEEGTSKHVVVVNKEKKPFISGLHTIVAKGKTSEVAHEYRRYCFQTPAVRQQFLFYAVGTKVSGISKTNIVKIILPVPSVPEQNAIASILSDMDAEIFDLEAQLAKTHTIKQGMMNELLTGKIRLL
jgi:type I restriction enzyme S subunit